MSPFTSADDKDPRPADQREAAANVHLNPNEPAVDASAGTPHYGDFGKPRAEQTPQPRDGSNDNPDEFSEFRDEKDAIPRKGTTDSGDPNPHRQTGYVQQNRDPQAVKHAQGDVAGQGQKEEDNTREAWAQDDERYAGGHQRASWTEQNDQEHDNS